MIRMQIQFSERQARALRRAAIRGSVSQSEVVRRAVDAFLGPSDGPGRDTLRTRAEGLVGAFADPAPDVSRRHDDYLADSIAEGSDPAGRS